MKNIYAYTESDGYKTYPGFLSYNKAENGAMVLSVRSTESSSPQEIQFPLFRVWQLVEAVANFNSPADVSDMEFLTKAFFDKLADQYQQLEQQLAAEREAREKAERNAKEFERDWLEASDEVLRLRTRIGASLYAAPIPPADVAELQRQVDFWKNSSEEWKLAYVSLGGTASESGKEELTKHLEEAKRQAVPEFVKDGLRSLLADENIGMEWRKDLHDWLSAAPQPNGVDK